MPASRVELRRVAAVRRIVRAWRELTGGTSRLPAGARRTLIACSGGADSSALAIALAAASRDLAIAHVLHDLRPAGEAEADQSAARDLAGRLNLPFLSASVRVRVGGKSGNAEGEARRARYRALGEMAVEARCPFVATAHHADDQLETILMQLIRGRRGLTGAAECRPLRVQASRLSIIRPMLAIGRVDAEAICSAAAWEWREDATNADATRLRAALRACVLPRLREIAPGIAAKAVRAARLHRERESAIEALASLAAPDRVAGGLEWARSDLRGMAKAVRATVLRRAIEELGERPDALAGRTLDAMSCAIAGHARATFAAAGVRVEVDRAVVRLTPL